MEKKSKQVTIAELNHMFFHLMNTKQAVIRAETDHDKAIADFGNLANRTSAKVLAEWACTEAFTDYVN